MAYEITTSINDEPLETVGPKGSSMSIDDDEENYTKAFMVAEPYQHRLEPYYLMDEDLRSFQIDGVDGVDGVDEGCTSLGACSNKHTNSLGNMESAIASVESADLLSAIDPLQPREPVVVLESDVPILSNYTMEDNQLDELNEDLASSGPSKEASEEEEAISTGQDSTEVPRKRGKNAKKRKTSIPVKQDVLDEYDALHTMDGIFTKSHCFQALVGYRKFATFAVEYETKGVSPFQSNVTGVSWNSWNKAWVAHWYENGKLKAEYYHTNKTTEGPQFETALQAAIKRRKEMEKKLNIAPRKGRRGPRYPEQEALRLAIQARNEAVKRGDIVPKSVKSARFKSGYTGVIWNNNNMAWQAHWKQNGKSNVVSFPTGRTSSGPNFESALAAAIAKREEMEKELGIKPRKRRDNRLENYLCNASESAQKRMYKENELPNFGIEEEEAAGVKQESG